MLHAYATELASELASESLCPCRAPGLNELMLKYLMLKSCDILEVVAKMSSLVKTVNRHYDTKGCRNWKESESVAGSWDAHDAIVATSY